MAVHFPFHSFGFDVVVLHVHYRLLSRQIPQPTIPVRERPLRSMRGSSGSLTFFVRARILLDPSPSTGGYGWDSPDTQLDASAGESAVCTHIVLL